MKLTAELTRERQQLIDLIEKKGACEETEAAFRSVMATALTMASVMMADAIALGEEAVTEHRKEGGFLSFVASASLVRLAFQLSESNQLATATIFCALEEILSEAGVDPSAIFKHAATAAKFKGSATTATSETTH
jgi:hypothetical protein